MKKYNADKIGDRTSSKRSGRNIFISSGESELNLWGGCYERKRWKSDPPAFMCKKEEIVKIFKRGRAWVEDVAIRRCICKKSDPKSGNSQDLR